jgi:prepilin-type N-terminal cleavage/methylation domain-containing protein
MRTKPNQKSKLRSRGFTLLEVVVALGMMAMLIGGIFQVARTSLQLSQIVVEEQNSTMERNAFFNLLKNHFEQMPGNAVVRLESYDSSNGGVSRTLFNLTFQNVPMSFNWGDVPMTAEAIELATVEQRDVEILEDSDSTGDLEAEPIAEITLIENLWMCDCEVVDGRTLEHVTEWDNNGQLPLQVKFYCRFEPTADIMQQTFWVVPKQNPEVIFRQIMQQNPAGPQGTTGAGGNVPPITINPGQPIPGSGGGRPGGGSTPPGGIPSGGR